MMTAPPPAPVSPAAPDARDAPALYLASASPRRHALLAQLGVAFEPLLPGDDEDAEALEAPRPAEDPRKYVLRVTLAKLEAALARRAARGLPARPVLVADTTVALGGRILGKPGTPEANAEMLRALSGRTHRVMTAVALARGSGTERLLSTSRVTFARLKPAEIAAYVALGEGLDKAGGYAIQGAAARFVRRVDGSPTGIIGLPLHETAKLLGTLAPPGPRAAS